MFNNVRMAEMIKECNNRENHGMNSQKRQVDEDSSHRGLIYTQLLAGQALRMTGSARVG